MFRATIIGLIAVILQVSALPEHIEYLERDLASLPTEYRHIADEFRAKRAANDGKDSNAYCCKNWQYINNDEVHTKVQSTLVPQTLTTIIGYQDCHGNINPTRPPVPIPNTTRFPVFGRTTTPPTGPVTTPDGCIWVPVNKTETFMMTEFTTITYLVPNSYMYCAPEDYHCCSSYVMLNNNCVHESAVAGLEYLIQLGLIGGIGKK